MTVFLRGQHVELRPVSRGERETLAHTPWLAHEGEDDILLAVGLPGAPALGLLALRGVDWVGRQAGLAAWWRDAPAAPAPPVAEDAVRTVVAYAIDELNLDAVLMRALTADAAHVLGVLRAERTEGNQEGQLAFRRRAA